MPQFKGLFDEHFDALCLSNGTGTYGLRWTAALCTATLMAVATGPGYGAIWLAAYALGELGMWRSHAALVRRPGFRARTVAAAAWLATSMVWASAALVHWREGSAPLQFVATCMLTTILVVAQTQMARSRTLVAIMAGPPLLLLVALPLATSGFSGAPLLMSCIAVATVAAWFFHGVRRFRDMAESLESSRCEALEASQAKSQFLAMMSHEIRTPMNGVLGMARVLAAGPLNDEQRRQVNIMINSGVGLMSILNDVLDLSKIEAGKLTLEEKVFDIREIVEEVTALFESVAAEKRVSLACEFTPQAPRWVLGDPTRIRQVLLNLVSNALKFTESGGVRVRLEEGEGDLCLLNVRDTGIGMSPEQQGRLFQAFSQADATITRRFGGTGLGLTIAYQIAAAMGGGITVASAPGSGSTFSVLVRLPTAEPPLAGPATAAAASLPDSCSILVADDNLMNQEVIRAVLSVTGATVDVVNDGQQALLALRHGRYDVVLMDIQMPVMGGAEALRRIRAGETGNSDQPVIAFTADANGDADRELVKLGFDAVEHKPINSGSLLSTISDILQSPGLSTTAHPARRAG